MIAEALYHGTGVMVCADDTTMACIMLLGVTLMISMGMWVLLLSTSTETPYNRSMNITKYIACVALSTLSACVHVPPAATGYSGYNTPVTPTYYTEYSYRARPVYPYAYSCRPAVTYREPYRMELHSRNWGSVDQWHFRYEGRP